MLIRILENPPKDEHRMGTTGSTIAAPDAMGRRAAVSALASLSAITDNEAVLLDLNTIRVLITIFNYSEA